MHRKEIVSATTRKLRTVWWRFYIALARSRQRQAEQQITRYRALLHPTVREAAISTADQRERDQQRPQDQLVPAHLHLIPEESP